MNVFTVNVFTVSWRQNKLRGVLHFLDDFADLDLRREPDFVRVHEPAHSLEEFRRGSAPTRGSGRILDLVSPVEVARHRQAEGRGPSDGPSGFWWVVAKLVEVNDPVLNHLDGTRRTV